MSRKAREHRLKKQIQNRPLPEVMKSQALRRENLL